jgi:hypothetical protein
VLGASSAVSTPTPVQVDVDAPDGCADSRAFFERLRARTDRVRLAQSGEDSLTIDVKLSRVGPKVHGELRLKQQGNESATRQVDGATCEEVLGVLSLTAALALERMVSPHTDASDGAPNGNQNGDASSGAGGAAKQTPNSVGAAGQGGANAAAGGGGAEQRSAAGAGAAADFNRPAARNLRLELGAELGLTQVLSPLLATGAGAFLRVRHEGMSLGLSAAYWSSALTNGGDSAKLRDVAFGLSACPFRVQLGLAHAEPCVLASVGLLRVSDDSALNPRAVSRSLWGVGALGRYRVPLTPAVSLEVEVGVTLPLVERRFVTEGPERIVAKTPWISPFVGLGAAVSP